MKLLRALLFPIAILYGFVTGARNALFNTGVLKSERFKLPVICVGNLSVGGTGKSPHIEYLVRLLSERYRVATLSRGYGRSTKGFLLADDAATAETIGDEPRQFQQKFPQLTVAVDEVRARGIHTLLRAPNAPEAILLDDAYQHRAVSAGFNVLLTTYQAPYFQDFMLPTGNLREYAGGARRADAIVVTKCPPQLGAEAISRLKAGIGPRKHQQLYFSYFAYDEPQALNPAHQAITLQQLQQGAFAVVLLTGIANPSDLLELLSAKAPRFEHVKFPDHHQYRAADVQKVQKIFDSFAGQQRVVITTEKDATRLTSRPLADLIHQLPIYQLPITVQFHNNGAEAFNAQILAYAARANEGNR